MSARGEGGARKRGLSSDVETPPRPRPARALRSDRDAFLLRFLDLCVPCLTCAVSPCIPLRNAASAAQVSDAPRMPVICEEMEGKNGQKFVVETEEAHEVPGFSSERYLYSAL